MDWYLTIMCVLTLFLGQIHGQPSVPSNPVVNRNDVCLASSPQIQGMFDQMERRFQQLESKVNELNEWKEQHKHECGQQNPESATVVCNPVDCPGAYKVFFIGFLKNYPNGGNNSLMISSKNAATVHIYSRQPAYDKTYNIESNGFLRITEFPEGSRVGSNNMVTQQGILVNSTEDLWVQGGNAEAHTIDGFSAIRVCQDSKEFITISSIHKYYSTLSSNSALLAVGTEEKTSVKIFTPVRGGGSVQAKEFILNKLDTYALYAPKDIEVSGFKVVSDKPIAVYSGHQCGGLGSSWNCDHMISSIPPISQLGTAYIVPPYAGIPGANGYILKIVATKANTDITIFRDTVLGSVNLGESQFYNWTITPSDEPLNVRCSKPCLVAQFAMRNAISASLRADPFMLLVTPNSALDQSVRFYTLAPSRYPGEYFRSNYLIIISFNQTGTSYQLNNETLQTQWLPISGMNGGSYLYSVTKIEVGFYHLKSTCEKGGFAAYVQGFDSNLSIGMSYGYRVGRFF